MELKLPKETEQRLATSLQRYLREELGEEVGDLKAMLFLRFCLEEIAPSIYNQAIQDARVCMLERVADLENICFLKDGNYWKQPGARSRRS